MRKSSYLALIIVGASILFMVPAITTGQGKGPKGGGGFDPGMIFDRMAANRGYILISDVRSRQDVLKQFAQEQNITDGKITRAQYLAYFEYMKAKLTAAPQGPGGVSSGPGGGNPFGGKSGKGQNGFDPSATPFNGGMQFGGGNPFSGKGPKGGGGGIPQGMVLNPEAMHDLADREFKRYDTNGDHKLNKDEMPTQLLAVLATWDKNGDSLIDQTEYRSYFTSRFQDDGNLSRAIATIIIEDDELERKPVVFKAGNLPRNIPPWFKDLDTDNDGQVALYEWRAGKKPLEEFRNWDLNDDGYIIPEEAMRTQEILTKNTTRAGDSTSVSSGFGNSEGPSFGNGERPTKGEWGGKKDKKGFGGGGENPFGGFKKGKKGYSGGNGNGN